MISGALIVQESSLVCFLWVTANLLTGVWGVNDRSIGQLHHQEAHPSMNPNPLQLPAGLAASFLMVELSMPLFMLI